jgi:hypothetical protein
MGILCKTKLTPTEGLKLSTHYQQIVLLNILIYVFICILFYYELKSHFNMVFQTFRPTSPTPQEIRQGFPMAKSLGNRFWMNRGDCFGTSPDHEDRRVTNLANR